jgi:GTP-binding protein YchF
MALSLGIVGLPNVGKSSLFNALTGSRAADAQNYPFTTIDPNVGVVTVPDARLTAIAEVARAARIVPAAIEFVDIAGLVKGANTGEGLGNQFLANIRETDAIVEVVRAFEDPGVIHVEGGPDPLRDFDIIETELILKDLESVEKRWEKVQKEARAGLKEGKAAEPVVTALRNALREGRPARSVPAMLESDGEREQFASEVHELALLTSKPLLVLMNAPQGAAADAAAVGLAERGVASVVVDVKEELEAAGLTTEERRELGVQETSALDALVAAAYDLLNLMSFLTAGEKEARAWTIRKNTKAPQAAGVIHSDFEQKFIRMDAVNWELFVQHGGWKGAREKGLVRSEGKEYVVADGDVVEIKHG